MSEQQNWYFTFGSAHEHPNGYVKINGTFSEARQKMMDVFGAKWSFQYNETEFLPQIEKWNLKEVVI